MQVSVTINDLLNQLNELQLQDTNNFSISDDNKAKKFIQQLTEDFNNEAKREEILNKFNSEIKANMDMLKDDWMPRLIQHLYNDETRIKIIDDIKFSTCVKDYNKVILVPIILLVAVCRLNGEALLYQTQKMTTPLTKEKKTMMDTLLKKIEGVTVIDDKEQEPNTVRATELLNNFIESLSTQEQQKEFEDKTNADLYNKCLPDLEKQGKQLLEDFVKNDQSKNKIIAQFQESPFLQISNSCQFTPLMDLHYCVVFQK